MRSKRRLAGLVIRSHISEKRMRLNETGAEEIIGLIFKQNPGKLLSFRYLFLS